MIRDSMSVQEYIDKHELTKVVEDAVNAAVKVKPDEPLSFLVRALLHAYRSTIARSRACIPPVQLSGSPARMRHARWDAAKDTTDWYEPDRSRVDSCPNFRRWIADT